MKGEWVISVVVSVGVGGKWTLGESRILEEDAKGNGETELSTSLVFRIGRGDMITGQQLASQKALPCCKQMLQRKEEKR